MIFSHQIKYKIQPEIFKVHFFCPAFDDSVVIVGLKDTVSDSLWHFDKHSQLVFQYDFNDYVDTLCMPSDRHAVVLRPDEGLILIFDLLEKKKYEIKHLYFTDVTCQSNADFFSDTSLLSVVEKGDHDHLRMMITYYHWPLNFSKGIEEPPDIFVEFDEGNEVWDPSYRVEKINAHSKYMWSQTRFKDQFVLRVHQIRDGKSHYEEISVKMDNLYRPYNLTSMEAAIVEAWEFQPDVLLMFCTSDRKQNKNAINPQTGVLNNTFIWNTKLGTIRESKFTLPPKFQDLQIDMHGTPSFSMFRTLYFEPGRAVPSPAYFVDNSKEEIIMEQQWTCCHLQKYRVFERNRDIIVESYHDTDHTKELSIRMIGMFARREMSLYLLKEMKDKPLNCVDSWDSDLLRDIFSRLNYEEYE